MKRHVIIGAGAAVLLLAAYLGIVALAESLSHAWEQALDLWYWMAALAIGFGVQAGLFSFVRRAMRERRAPATASVATSGGVSAGAMAACCAHHLTDVLPLLGLAGLSAFLASYQTLFLLVGVLSNVIGITIMLECIQRHSLSRRLAGLPWRMGWMKRGSMAASVLILGVLLLRAFFVS